MNCTQIEKLLPLYVGGDLATRQVTQVRQHLESCAHCRGIVIEFVESRSWLRNFTAPQFDEAVFDDLRDAVRGEITRVQSRPPLYELLLSLWNRRFVLVASSALALLIAGLMLYLNSNQLPDKPVITKKGGVQSDPTPGMTGDKDQNGSQRNRGNNITRSPSPQTGPGNLATINQSRRGPALPGPDPITDNPLPVLETIALNNHLFERILNIGGQEISIPTYADLVRNRDAKQDADREMLRIEIQTADPNIRIIWFVPKDEPSPNFKPQIDTK